LPPIDVGLHNKPVAGFVLRLQVFARFDDGECHFVAEHDWLFFHAAVDARMFFSGSDHLDV
jgi:hypothetical protein